MRRRDARQVSQNVIEARPRLTLREVARRAAPQPAPDQPAAVQPPPDQPAAVQPAADQPAPDQPPLGQSGTAQPPVTLASRAAAGDREAWDQIVERYAPLVWTICRRHRLTDHDSRDVGERVWLLLLDQIGPRQPAALPEWLAKTTSRECLRVLQAAWQAGQPAAPGDQDDATADAEILAAELNATLRAAILALPPSCQQMLSMLLSDPPHSDAEISAALHIPVGRIGPQRTRCLELLRRAMKDSG